ncbi:MAG: hypothetical protein ABSB40_04380 [Nitrososphaeria archaeon]
MSSDTLKCPSCGALLESKDIQKCKYCGAILVFDYRKNIYTAQLDLTCPKCNTLNEKGRWYCKHCLSIFSKTLSSKELEKVKEEQKSVRFKQEKARNILPSNVLQALGLVEYIHYVLQRGSKDNNFIELITNEQIIHYHFQKGFMGIGKREELWKALYDDIISFREQKESSWKEVIEEYESTHFLWIHASSGDYTISVDTSSANGLDSFLKIQEELKNAFFKHTNHILDADIVYYLGEIL